MSTPNENPDYAPKVRLKTTEGWVDEPPKLNYLEEIKRCIRQMPYGDVMDLARVIKASGSEDEYTFAQQLWEWANAESVE